MRKIQALLFDLDGVLVEAQHWHFEAFNKALSTSGYQPISYDDHIKRFDGLPTRRKLAMLSGEQGIPHSLFEDINRLKQNYTLEITRSKCAPNPIRLDTVRALHKAGYRLAVCSNSVRASVDLLLEKTGLSPFFTFTLSNEDVSQPKPSPEIYLKAMSRFGVSPHESLIIEDNINGIRSARDAGGHVLEIGVIDEVNYDNIARAIAAAEAAA